MTSTDKGKKFAKIAGILFIIYTVWGVATNIISTNGEDDLLYISAYAFNMLGYIFYIGFAITLFIKNKKFILIPVGLYALSSLGNIINNCFVQTFINIGEPYFLAYALLFVAIILVMKGNETIKKLWFLPAVIQFVGLLIYCIYYGWFSDLSNQWALMVTYIMDTTALVFIGLWLKESSAEKSADNK